MGKELLWHGCHATTFTVNSSSSKKYYIGPNSLLPPCYLVFFILFPPASLDLFFWTCWGAIMCTQEMALSISAMDTAIDRRVPLSLAPASTPLQWCFCFDFNHILIRRIYNSRRKVKGQNYRHLPFPASVLLTEPQSAAICLVLLLAKIFPFWLPKASASRWCSGQFLACSLVFKHYAGNELGEVSLIPC